MYIIAKPQIYEAKTDKITGTKTNPQLQWDIFNTPFQQLIELDKK